MLNSSINIICNMFENCESLNVTVKYNLISISKFINYLIDVKDYDEKYVSFNKSSLQPGSNKGSLSPINNVRNLTCIKGTIPYYFHKMQQEN